MSELSEFLQFGRLSSCQSVVHFVAICIISCMSFFLSDAPTFSLSMDATMGLRTELRFHKAEKILTAEDGFVFMR